MSWHEILNTVLLNFRPIIKLTFLFIVILFLILWLVYPRTYNATSIILPPEKNNSIGGLSSLLANQDFTNLLSGNLNNSNAQLYAEILRSRSAALYVINKLKIQKLYDNDDIYIAAAKLTDELNIDINKENVLRINVNFESGYLPFFFNTESSDKKFAALITNTFVEALDQINREKMISKSRKTRIFIQSQIIETKAKLDSTENALMLFQKRNKSISLPDQLKASLESAAKIKSEIITKEMELELLKSDVDEQSKLYSSLNKKIEELQLQYEKMSSGNSDFLLSFNDIPEIGRQLANLLRETKIQNEIFIFLQQQYYKEKIQEKRDLPTIEVLDEAVPPSKKSSPKILSTTLIGFLFFFFSFSTFYVIKQKK